jgi:tight adherence protein C
MPTSDLVTVTPMLAAGLIDMLPLICGCLFGVSIGLVIFLLGKRLGISAAPVAAVIGDAQRRLRRESLSKDAGIAAFVLPILPAVAKLTKTLPLDAFRSDLRARYASAGWPGGLDDEELLALSLLIGLALAIPVMLLVLLVNPFAMPAGLIFVLAGPSLVSSHLSSIGTARVKSISRNMPYVLDMLVLTMRAGASMPIAIERVGVDFQGTPIGTEFRAILSDLEMGVTLRQGYENLAQRAPVPVVRQFVDDVVQSEELGRPIAETLERLADRVRVRRVQEATETAGKAKVMVLVPGMLVFAATLLLLFAPFIVRYYYEGLNIG